MNTTTTIEWLSDAKGNKCSVQYFGSREAAQRALDSLKGCENCTNCSFCSFCSYCLGCSRCSDCSGCSFCSDKNGLVPQPLTEAERVTVPVIPNIHQQVYEAVTRTPDALNMWNWHTCETTHCRAGWVVTLAGEAGRKLEAFHNTAMAAALIYHASAPDLPVGMPRFYEDNATALADMKRMAELEAARSSLPSTPAPE